MNETNLRVAFDDQIFITQRYGGISRYFSCIAREMAAMKGINAKIIAPLHRNAHASCLSNNSIFGVGFPAIPKSGLFLSFSSQMLSKYALTNFSPHIVHETYYTRNPQNCGEVARIITVFDMIHELFPEQFNDARSVIAAKRLAVERADHVLCISEKTQRDLVRIFNIDPAKTSVTHLGFEEPKLTHGIEKKSKVSRPYILYVGNRGGYKNFDGLLKAFASSCELRSNFRIVCFGGGRFREDERQRITALGLTSANIEQWHGGDGRLAMAYRSASALVYPSLYEGFGIPLLEAMSVGCAVVASNTSSIPEVVGNAAELFDPADTDSLLTAIENVVLSPKRNASLISLGYQRCKQFSWKSCAERTVDVYRRFT